MPGTSLWTGRRTEKQMGDHLNPDRVDCLAYEKRKERFARHPLLLVAVPIYFVEFFDGFGLTGFDEHFLTHDAAGNIIAPPKLDRHRSGFVAFGPLKDFSDDRFSVNFQRLLADLFSFRAWELKEFLCQSFGKPERRWESGRLGRVLLEFFTRPLNVDLRDNFDEVFGPLLQLPRRSDFDFSILVCGDPVSNNMSSFGKATPVRILGVRD